MPVAERSSLPGATTTAFRVTWPTPSHGAAISTMLTPAISGFSGCTQAQLLARSGADQLTGERGQTPPRARSRNRGVRIGEPAHPPVSDVDVQRAQLLHLELGVEVLHEAGDVRELDALAASLATRRAGLDDPARGLEPNDGLRLLRSSRSPTARSPCRSCSSLTSPDTRSAP